MSKFTISILTFLLACLSSFAADTDVYPTDYSTWRINGRIGIFTNEDNVKNSGYVVILGGGTNTFLWNECVQAYQFFVYEKGYQKSHIYVAYDTKDLLDGKYNVPLDLDFDGQKDIQYELNNETVSSIFNNIASKITKNDNFVLFIATHGGDNAACINQYSSSCTMDYANFFKKELNKIKAKHIYVLSGSCHGGAMIEHLKVGDGNRTIITSTSANKTANAGALGGMFLCQFFPAAAGYDTDSAKKIKSDSIDIDNDGKISVEEAFVYARDHDGSAKASVKNESWYESPRFWSSTSDFRYCKVLDQGVFNQNEAITKSTNVEAMYLLNARNTIKNNANVTYSSGKYIRLKKGFHVVKGSKFKTKKIDCEDEKNGIYGGEFKYLTIDEDVIYEEPSEELSTSNLILYPNPTDGEFYISFADEDVDFNITVTDMTGKTIYVASGIGHDQEVNLEGQASGVYFVRISTNEMTETRKVILK